VWVCGCVGVWVSKLIESLFLETLSSQIRFTGRGAVGIGVKLRDLNAQHPTPNAQLPREK
jgi:hypothetical protein